MDDAQFSQLLSDLGNEAAALLDVLRNLEPEQWQIPTPAEGWNIHDQVVHLAYFDDLVGLGFTDPDGFETKAAELEASGEDWVDRLSHDRSAIPPTELVDWFSTSRASAIDRFAQLGPSARTPWFGPSMSAASSATARLMETWAHGQDIYDALSVHPDATDRIRHICHLGVITRGFSYRVRGAEPPPAEVRVELTAPDESLWTWGAETLPDRVVGTASDFALVVTQRRNIADTSLAATPGAAAEWMTMAQAFAGAPGTGRPAGQFARTE